jgi:two-component sensor histidine kinase/tetratricopeptide (TPR) repeat protein
VLSWFQELFVLSVTLHDTEHGLPDNHVNSLFPCLLACLFSLTAFAQSPPQFQGQGPDTLLVKGYLEQSELAREIDHSLLWAQKALALAQNERYDTGIAYALIRIGDIFLEKKEYARALTQYADARPLLTQMKDEACLARSLKSSGDCYSARSYYRQAFDCYREAAPLFRQTGQLKLLNDCQEAMGNLALDFGQTQGAIGHYKRSLIVKNSLHDVPGILATTSKIAKAYLSLMQYDSALSFTKEVQHLAGNNRTALTDATIDEFIVRSFQKRLVEAGEAKAAAERLTSLLGDSMMTIRLLVATSNYYLAQNDREKAGLYFDSAAAHIQRLKSPELAIAGLTMIAEMSRQNGDYQTAYTMIKRADTYKDIFRTENIDRVSAEIRNAAEASLREREIEYLKRENALKAEKLRDDFELRRALIRQNQLIDSSLERQRRLTVAREVESNLRNEQLIKETNLRVSLSREQELTEERLNAERRNRILLSLGIGALLALGSIISFQYRKQRINNALIRRQSEDLKILHKEIHHRVKNNLQVISSMLDLQSQSLNDQRATAIIKEAIERVQAMAFIHQNLYQGEAANTVNMNEYIKILADHLFQSYTVRPERIRFHTNIVDLRLHTDSAIPLGMILNELVSNSLKYAFKSKDEGDIWITMTQDGGELFLQVRDNGVGLPAGFDPENTPSFGFEIIRAFAQKLRARMTIDGRSGVDVQFVISKFKVA